MRRNIRTLVLLLLLIPLTHEASAQSTCPTVYNDCSVTQTFLGLCKIPCVRVYIAGKGVMINGASGNGGVYLTAVKAAEYMDAMHRFITGSPTPPSLFSTYMEQMRTNRLTREKLISIFWSKPLHRQAQTKNLYQRYFKRVPTSAEITETVALFTSGKSEEEIIIQLLKSATYNSLNPTLEAKVNAFFQDHLGTILNQGELANAVREAQSLGWSTYVTKVIYSPEWLSLLVANSYWTILGRAATKSEMQDWIAKLKSKQFSSGGFVQNLLSSAEAASRNYRCS